MHKLFYGNWKWLTSVQFIQNRNNNIKILSFKTEKFSLCDHVGIRHYVIRMKNQVQKIHNPTQQGSSIVRRIRTRRWEDDLLWAHMKVFRTSFYVPAFIERNSCVWFGRDVDARSFLRSRRKRTSGRLSHGPKVRRPLNVRGRLAEWDETDYIKST